MELAPTHAPHDADEPPTTKRSADVERMARQSEETTVVIPSALLITLRAETARDDAPRSNVEIVELDPDELVVEDGVFDESVPSRDVFSDPHVHIQGGEDEDDALDDVDAAFESIAGV